MLLYDGIYLAMFWSSSLFLVFTTDVIAFPTLSCLHTCLCHSSFFFLINKSSLFIPALSQTA